MKVICVKESSYHLTKNKIYDVYPVNHKKLLHYKGSDDIFDYIIVNDRGFEHFVESSIFKNLDDIREEKIKIIFNI